MKQYNASNLSKSMKTLFKNLTTFFISILLLSFIITPISANQIYDKYEFRVEETSNFFPVAVTGYEKLSNYFETGKDKNIYAEYMIYAPGYKIVKFDFELTYDNQILKYVNEGVTTPTPAGTIITPPTIIPEINKYGVSTFDSDAKSSVDGRGKMVVSYTGYSDAVDENGDELLLVKVPFQIFADDKSSANIDLHVTTLAFEEANTIYQSDNSEIVPDTNLIYIVENGIVNELFTDIYALTTTLEPTGTELPPIGPDKTLKIDIRCPFSPGMEPKTLNVGENVEIELRAPTKLDITYMSIQLHIDKELVSLRDVTTFDYIQGRECSKTVFNYDGYYYFNWTIDSQDEPFRLNKGETIVKFVLQALDTGETTIDLNVSMQDPNNMLTISGTSDFSPNVPEQKVYVGNSQVTLSFVAPEDLDLTYFAWNAEYDDTKVSVTDVKAIDIVSIDSSYGKTLNYTKTNASFILDSPNKVIKVKKGDVIASFTFDVIGKGETIVKLNATTERSNHTITIDMGGHSNNITVDVKEGTNLYSALTNLNLRTNTDDGEYLLICLHTKKLSDMKSANEYQSIDFIDKSIFDMPVISDITVYGIFLKIINVKLPEIQNPTKDNVLTEEPKITIPENAHYTVSNPFFTSHYPFEGYRSTYEMELNIGNTHTLGHITIDSDFGYIFDNTSTDIKTYNPRNFNQITKKDTYTCFEAIWDQKVDRYYYTLQLSFFIPCSTGDSKVDKTINDINSIPNLDKITLENIDDIKAIIEEYNLLTDEQKKLIPKDVVDTIKAANVISDIISLLDVDKITLENKDEIKAIIANLEKLTGNQKNLIPQEVYDKIMAANVIVDILSLPDSNKITKNDKTAIENARMAYENLTEEQKKLVSKEVLDKLIASEKALEKSGGSNIWIIIILIVVLIVATGVIVIIVINKNKKQKQQNPN